MGVRELCFIIGTKVTVRFENGTKVFAGPSLLIRTPFAIDFKGMRQKCRSPDIFDPKKGGQSRQMELFQKFGQNGITDPQRTGRANGRCSTG
jgi:hypothetical protein